MNIPPLFQDIHINGRDFPEWMVHDFRSEAYILSRRIVCAEMGESWDWQGITETHFNREDYRIIFKVCRWLESQGQDCTQSNVIFIAEKKGVISSRVRFMHKIAHSMDEIWSTISFKEFDHIAKLKRLNRRRKVIKNAEEAIYKVLNNSDPDYALEELGNQVSLKFRKSRRKWG